MSYNNYLYLTDASVTSSLETIEESYITFNFGKNTRETRYTNGRYEQSMSRENGRVCREMTKFILKQLKNSDCYTHIDGTNTFIINELAKSKNDINNLWYTLSSTISKLEFAYYYPNQ